MLLMSNENHVRAYLSPTEASGELPVAVPEDFGRAPEQGRLV
jgi:hypothetical protein